MAWASGPCTATPIDRPKTFIKPSRLFSRKVAVALATLLACETGCPPPHPALPPGPPRTLEEIVATLHDNAARIDHPLYASPAHVRTRFVDPDGWRRDFNLDGTLVVRKPRDFRLDLRHPLGESVMQVGCNADDYWVWIKPELATLWWGRRRHLDKPCADPTPLRPEHIAAALGLHALPDARDGLIGPARYLEPDVDRLLFIAPTGDGLFRVDREIDVDRHPPFLIRAVLFRDDYGRPKMRADLDDYRPAWPDGPLLAHRVRIHWPADDGRLDLSIDAWRIPEAVSPRAFVRPVDPPPGITRVVQVDRACDLLETLADEVQTSRPTTTPSPTSDAD